MLPAVPGLSTAQLRQLQQLASCGLHPTLMAAALDLPEAAAADFVRMANTPGTALATLIASARAVAEQRVVASLQTAAGADNIEAAKELDQRLQRIQFNNYIRNMDDDECC